MVSETELFESTDLTALDFLSVGLDEEWSIQKKVGYTRRTVRSHFGCCCPRKET